MAGAQAQASDLCNLLELSIQCHFDVDSKSSDLSRHDALGHIQVSVAEVVQGRLERGRPLLESGNKTAKIFVTARQTVECRELYVMNFIGRGLDNKDFLGKSDPYLVFYKFTPDGKWVSVAQTNIVSNNLNPDWAPLSINCATFCDKNPATAMFIECFDYDNDGSHDLIGTFQTTAKELFDTAGSHAFPLINEKKKAKKKKYQNSGTVTLRSFRVEEECEFLFYVQAGLQLSFIVAIDFTASNGNPSHPQSLHYFNPSCPYNQYTTAIDAVGQVIQEYDSDKLFPVFGFGGCFFGNSTHFNFPLGILDAYKYALSQSQLSGPTNFSPVISSATRMASQYQSGLHYFVLLIITDGAITDLQWTKNAIVEASQYPLSIIIVGVGNAEFDSMEELDCDKGVLTSSSGKRAQRDIVQFVPLRDVFGSHFDPRDMYKYQAELSRQVLAEVPRQVKDYLKPRGIYPSKVHEMFLKEFPPPPSSTPEASASAPLPQQSQTSI